jgi:hypothetical protein
MDMFCVDAEVALGPIHTDDVPPVATLALVPIAIELEHCNTLALVPIAMQSVALPGEEVLLQIAALPIATHLVPRIVDAVLPRATLAPELLSTTEPLPMAILLPLPKADAALPIATQFKNAKLLLPMAMPAGKSTAELKPIAIPISAPLVILLTPIHTLWVVLATPPRIATL